MSMPTWLLPHLPADKIMAAYAAAPGKEIDSDKLSSEESSAALAANTFGYFLDRPDEFPLRAIFDGTDELVHYVQLECELRFPWNGGLHPWLDAVIETDTWLIGIESKRYEPFRARKQAAFSDSYLRNVWGERMGAYEAVRDHIIAGSYCPVHLDCAQLVKHAFGIRTQATKFGKKGALIYIFAEPQEWPDKRPIPASLLAAHRAEAEDFSKRVIGAEVMFATARYRDLFDALLASSLPGARNHGRALDARFHIEPTISQD